MKCPKCGNMMELDALTNQYFCEECCKLYDAEEVEGHVTVPVLFLSFLMWIPILNFIVTRFIDKAPAEDRKAYYSILLSSLMMHACLLLIGCYIFVWYRDTEIRFARQTLQQANEVLFDEEFGEVEWKYPELTVMKDEIKQYAEEQKKLQEMNELIYTDELIESLDGSYVSGETLRYLINRYKEYTYLLQTKSLRTKHNNINVYLNIGRYLREADGEEHKIIDCSLHDTFTQLLSSAEYDAIDAKNTIYYVYDTEMFRVDFIYNKRDEIIGMSFTELEV